MSYAKLIVNPEAGAGKTRRYWPQIMGLLRKTGLRFEYEVTEAPGHAVELAKSAAKNGYDLVVSVGGDGTINEVVNGLYAGGGLGDITLGIINSGSGGDYIRTLGLPRDHRAACERLTNPHKMLLDLGVVEYVCKGQPVKRLFVNFAGLGFDAEIVRATTLQFKKLGATPSYLMGLLTTFLCYRNKKMFLTVDGETREKRICTAVMGNGRYGGGGMLVAPNADPQDGLLDVVVVADLDKLDLLRSLPRIYKGTHITHPKVSVKRGKRIEIKPGEGVKMSLQADGELLGQAPASFYTLPAVLSVAV